MLHTVLCELTCLASHVAEALAWQASPHWQVGRFHTLVAMQTYVAAVNRQMILPSKHVAASRCAETRLHVTMGYIGKELGHAHCMHMVKRILLLSAYDPSLPELTSEVPQPEETSTHQPLYQTQRQPVCKVSSNAIQEAQGMT